MKLVWMVVVHFIYYGYNIPVVPHQASAVYTSARACAVARNSEVAYWETVSYPKPVSIDCEAMPVHN